MECRSTAGFLRENILARYLFMLYRVTLQALDDFHVSGQTALVAAFHKIFNPSRFLHVLYYSEIRRYRKKPAILILETVGSSARTSVAVKEKE